MPAHCSSFLLSPLETHVNDILRALFYSSFLAYCFLGLSAITARFFHGMENVSGRSVVRRENVWNFVVADIALLAFGTSFPQISLATIDACLNLGNLYAGGVGPGTLVGSATCDLFLIHAMCIIIPKRGALKRVIDLNVWIVELAWSLWAYLWLYIILLVWTPEVITIWEVGLTVLQFFILVLHCYAQDKGWPYISITLFDMKKRESWISSDPRQETSDSNLEQGQNALSLLVDPVIRTSATEGEHVSHTMLLWKQQFYDVLTLNGQVSSGKKITFGVAFLYELLAFPWKLCFAFVPPHNLCHGWVTFLYSLVFITGISYIVTQLTDVIGCVTGISSYVIALTVLATGTSWPDLAASMIAAYRQSIADSAMANIICSNSVNIFIGIGVPWVISTVYNRIVLKDVLRVPSLQLGFILIAYFITSILCIIVLVARRYFLGGELGGPRKWAWASAIFILLLWVAFIVFSCLKIYKVI